MNPALTAPRSASAREERRPLDRLAAVLSEVFAPLVQVATQSALILWSTPLGLRSAMWWTLALTFGSALPMLLLIGGVLKGSWLDHHVPHREHRVIPMTGILLSILLGLAALAAAAAPQEIRALFASLAVQLGILIAITRYWKISVHTSVATTTVIVAVMTHGFWCLVLAPIAPLTVWTRTRVRAHTLGQAVVGVAVGACVTVATLPLFTGG